MTSMEEHGYAPPWLPSPGTWFWDWPAGGKGRQAGPTTGSVFPFTIMMAVRPVMAVRP